MIFSRVVYDAQFSFVTIYKVGKCMMPSVLKICSDLRSRVVYSSLKLHRDSGLYPNLRHLEIIIKTFLYNLLLFMTLNLSKCKIFKDPREPYYKSIQ